MRGRRLWYVFGVLVLVYLAVTFLLPSDPQTLRHYHLSAVSLRLLSSTVALPMVLIWLAAFYGYDRLRSYSRLLKSGTESRPIATITNGLMVLAFSLPVTDIIAALLHFAAQEDRSLVAAAAIINSYVSLAFSLVAFVLINSGAGHLGRLCGKPPVKAVVHLLVILFSLIGVGYTYFVLHFAYVDGRGVGAAYHMPLPVVLLTLVVPYLYMWYIGLVAAMDLYRYQLTLKGVLYRRNWGIFSAGIATVILTLIVVQYLTTISDRLNRLTIVAVLLVVYGLLLLMSAGYILVAYGAKQLQKIEEV